jgi:hypothetical protein
MKGRKENESKLHGHGVLWRCNCSDYGLKFLVALSSILENACRNDQILVSEFSRAEHGHQLVFARQIIVKLVDREQTLQPLR